MKENPSYEELIQANGRLQEKLNWLEGVYQQNREAGMQIKSRFLSNISHEIRTPMNAILGFSSMLSNDTLSENQRDEYIQYIAHSSKTLLKVMDNIIDMSLLDSSNLQIKKENIFAEELLREIYEYYNSRVARSMNYRVALLLTTPREYGRITVMADGYRLQRVLDNLVNAAITNQKKGVVEMKLEIPSRESLRFSIISKKNALLEERAKMIFENNGKSDEWHNHIDATGMAYNLACELSVAMGGSVSLEQVGEERMAICIDLSINEIGIINRQREGKERVLLN